MNFKNETITIWKVYQINEAVEMLGQVSDYALHKRPKLLLP